MCCLEIVHTDSGHLPSILLHSCTLFGCSWNTKLQPHVLSHPHFRIAEFCSLCVGAQQDTGSPLLDPVLCLSHSAVSQILLEMFWESENYNSLGAVLWARVRCSPRRLKMHQIGIGHFSRETHDGENCKTTQLFSFLLHLNKRDQLPKHSERPAVGLTLAYSTAQPMCSTMSFWRGSLIPKHVSGSWKC